MTTTKSVLAFGVLSLVAGGLLAAGSMWPSGSADPPAPPPPAEVKVTAPTPTDAKPASPWREAKVLEQDGWLAGSVVYSPDGKTLYVGGTSGSGHVRAYDAATWKQLWEYKGDGRFAAVATAPDGKTLAVTVKDGVQFLDAATGKAGDLLEEKGSEPLAVAYLPFENEAGGVIRHKVIFGNARGYYHKTWIKWPNVATIDTAPATTVKHDDKYAVPLAAAPEGGWAVLTINVLQAWWPWLGNSSNGKSQKLEGHKAVVTSAAWSKNGKLIVTGDADGVVITWDAATFKEKSRLTLGGRVVAVAVSADGKHTAAAVASLTPQPNKNGNYTEEVYVWRQSDQPQGKIIRRQPDGIVEINIGSNDLVKPGSTFTILPADYPEKGRQSRLRQFRVPNEQGNYRTVERFVPKATIEVTEILGPNLSRARITREADYIRDGAQAGDLLYVGVEPQADGLKPISRTPTGGPFEGVASLAFAPDGKSLVSAYCNFTHLKRLGELRGKVRVFTLAAEEPKPEPTAEYVSHVEFSPDGKRYLVVSGKGIRAFDSANGKQLWEAPGEAARFTPDGSTVCVMGEKITCRDAATGAPESATHPRPKSKWGWQTVAFAPDGKRYAAHTGLEARVYDTATGFEPVRLDDQTDKIPAGTTGAVTSRELVWSPDGKKVAAVGVQIQGGAFGFPTMGAAVWDAETGNRLHVFGLNLGVPQKLAFSADGKLLAATFQERVVLYDAKTFKEVRNLGDQSAVTALTFSPDSKTLAVGIRLPIRPGDDAQNVRKWSYHTQVRVIDTETGKTVKAFDGFEGKDHPMEATKLPVTALAFSADGKKLIAGTGLTSTVPVFWGVVAHPKDLPKAGEVKVWTLDAAVAPGKPDPETAVRWNDAAVLADHGALANGVAVAPDGKTFAAATDNTLTVWDATTRKVLWKSKRADGPAFALAYSPDGRHICFAGLVGVARLDAKTGMRESWPDKRAPQFGKVVTLAYSPNGEMLAASNGYKTAVACFTGETRNMEFLGQKHEPPPVRPGGVAWSKDSTRLAMFHPEMHDGKCQVALMKPLGEVNDVVVLKGHTKLVTCVAWSKDGKVVASGDEGGVVILWDAETGKELWRKELKGRTTTGRVNALAISPADNTVAVAASMGSGKGPERVVLLEPKEGKDVDHLMRPWSIPVASVAWSPDGKFLLTGCGSAGRPVAQDEPPTGEVVVWERMP